MANKRWHGRALAKLYRPSSRTDDSVRSRKKNSAGGRKQFRKQIDARRVRLTNFHLPIRARHYLRCARRSYIRGVLAASIIILRVRALASHHVVLPLPPLDRVQCGITSRVLLCDQAPGPTAPHRVG